MKLTKNEKKVLNLLLNNARNTDSFIADKLKISSQAVGKIRKKLESTIIDSYNINLNYAKIGIRAFAISLSKITPAGLDKGELQIEKILMGVSNIIQAYRLPNSSCTHIILYGFKDLDDLDEFFHSKKNLLGLFKYVENKEIFTFSHNSLIKNDPSALFREIVEDMGNLKKNGIPELEKFKKGLEE
jgi:DNA-binding Lrp family transcriptional regulator